LLHKSGGPDERVPVDRSCCPLCSIQSQNRSSGKSRLTEDFLQICAKQQSEQLKFTDGSL